MGAVFRTTVLVVLLAKAAVTQAQAATIVAYESLNPMEGVAAGQVADGVIALPLTRGPGVEWASGNSFNTRGWTTDLNLDPNDYLEWGWCLSDHPLNLESLDIRYDRSGTGPAQLEVQLSIDDGAFQTIFSDTAVSSAGESVGIDLTTFSNIRTATFRLYGFQAASNSGTLDIENFSSAPNQAIVVTGSTAVPEPGTLALLVSVGISFVGFQGVRRRLSRLGQSTPSGINK